APVVGGGLHRHLLDPQASQLPGQLADRARGGRHLTPWSGADPAGTDAPLGCTPSPTPWPHRSRPPAPRSARAPHPRSPAAPASPGCASFHPWARSRAARGPRSGTEPLTGVLQAQCATRQGQSPSARLNPRAHDPETIPASAGNPTTFSRPRDVPAADTSTAPKIHGAQAGGSTRRSAAEPGPSRSMRADSGGGFQGDLVAEGLQLADVVALGALRVDPGVVEAGTEVVIAGLGIGQQVPDDDQDGAAHRHDGLLGASSAGDAPVALPEEGCGPPGDPGGLAQHPGQIRVAVPGRVLALGLAR